MNITTLFADIAAVAEKVAASILPGVPETIAAGQAVVKLITTAKDTFAQHDPAVLDAQLDALIPLVNADVDDAIAALRGTKS